MKYLCGILIGLGLIVSGYLLYRHFALAGLAGPSGSDFCSALFGRGCDDALRSPLAVQLGLPLAGWGLVYYGTLVALLLLASILGNTFRTEALTGALLMALAAAAASVALFVAMVSHLSPFCPLCATIHAVNLLLVPVIHRLTGQPVSESIRAVGGAVRYVVTGRTADPVGAKWKSVGFVAAALVAVVIYQWVLVEFVSHTQTGQTPFNPQQVVAQFESGIQREIPVSRADPALGPANAPVRMVVFSDFRCPGCRKLAGMIPLLARQFKDSLQIVFKHYPLDNACNPAVTRALHPGACAAARAAEAAHQQEEFWAFHDALFAPRPGNQLDVDILARDLALDTGRFEADMAGEPGLARILADIDTGTSLGVDGTPSVFINGRRVYDIDLKTLIVLIAHEANSRREADSHDGTRSQEDSATPADANE